MAKGQVDASAIDSQVLAVAMRDDPSLAGGSLRVIDALGPSTIQPVAVSKRLPDLREIRAVLRSVGDDPARRQRLDVGLVERFVPVGPEDYDDIG